MINFLGLNGRTAGLIRGKQVSARIENSEFFDSFDRRVGKNQVSIMIRNHFQGTAALNKSATKIIGYDICDMPVGDAIFRGVTDLRLENYCFEIYDFFIVNNDVCKSEIQRFTEKPVYVIPHHTTNFEKKRIKLNEKAKKVGYVGLPEQLCHSDKIANFCKEKKIDFVNVHPSSREECDKVFMSLDVGIIFVDDSIHSKVVTDAIKKYKPNTKLSNFQSYGVPTISADYESFAQFGKNAYIKASSIDELIENLSILIDDFDQRKALSDTSYEVAKQFHIDEIAKLYKNIVADYKL